MSISPVRVLLVDNDSSYYLLVEESLLRSSRPFELQWAPTFEDALEAIDRNDLDIALVNYDLGSHSGLDVLDYAQRSGSIAPVILLTEHPDDSTDQIAMEAGASDYLSKDGMNARSLERTIRCAIERSRMHEALRVSEERFRVALKHAPVIVVHQDLDLRYIWIHDPALESQAQSLIGLHDCDIVDEEGARELTRIKRGVLDSGIGAREIVRIIYNEKEHYYDITVEPLREHGRIVGVTCAAVDVTPHRKVTESLRVSEGRFRMLADSAPVLIWIADPEGHCTYFNQPWLNFTGRSIDELLDDRWTIDIHPDDIQECLDIYAGAFSARNSFRMEYRLRRFDGEYRWMLDTGVPIIDANGEFGGYIGSCIDITERVIAKRKLQASERLNHAILHSLSAHIAVLDREGWIMAVNSAWRKFGQMNGIDQLTGAGVGVNYLEVCRHAAEIGSLDGARALEGIRSVLDGGGEFTMEYDCHTPSERRWMLLSATALADFGGAVISHTDITERKMAEHALKESQELFRTFMDNSPAMAFMKDLRGRYVFINRQFAKLFTGSDHDLIGRDDWELFSEEVAKKFRKVDDLVITTGNTITAIDMLRHGGIERYWLTVKFPVYDASGELFVGGKSIEISERIRAEKSLRESEERFQLATRATNDAIWDWDIVTNHVSWNGNVQSLFHYNASEVHPSVTWWNERLHPDDHERVVKSVGEAIEGSGQSWSCEYRFRCGDGSYAYILDRGYLLRDDAGRAIRMIGAMTDMTTRKRAEDALRQSEAQYRRIIETAHEGILILDADGRITFANRRFTEMLGYTLDEIKGRFLHAFMDEEGKGSAGNVAAADDEEPTQCDYRFVRKDRSPMWAILSTSPILEQDGSYAGALAMVTDITARKHAEGALQDAHDKLEMRVAERTAELLDTMARLEQAHQIQQRFVADASHDLRTPLTVIRAELELLLQGDGFESSTRSSLTRISAEAKRLDDLANDLLLLATIDAQNQITHDTSLHVDDLIFDCVAHLRVLSAEKDLVWDVQVEEPVQLVCNGTMVERALMNVLENAIKYSHNSSIVQVSLGRSNGTAVITVADKGVGIPAADLPRVFDRFYRGDLTRNTDGTGLGLAIVKAVVDAHEGEVTIDSAPGEGTTVRIAIPC